MNVSDPETIEQSPVATCAGDTSDPQRTAIEDLSHALDTAVVTSISYEDCCWEDVLESMEQARKDFDNRMKKGAPKVYKNRAIVTTLESLTDLIPDKDGLNFLRGGLKLIFKLLQKRLDNQEKILQAFEDLPITFSQAGDEMQIHPEDSVLRKLVEALVKILSQEIPKLVAILQHQQKGSLPGRLFRKHPEHEAQAVSTSLDIITRAAQKISNRVQILGDKKISETWMEAKAVNVSVNKGLELINANQEQIEQRHRVRDEQNAMSLDAVATSVNQMQAEFRKIQTQIAACIATSQICRLPAREPDGRITTTLYQETISYGHLFALLDFFHPYLLAQDIEEVLRTSHGFGFTELGRAKWLLVTDRFQHWAQNSQRISDLILVNGYLGDVTIGKVSALSTLAALFASMSTVPGVIILHHFCSLHTQESDSMGGPRGLLRSLITQMILHLNQLPGGEAGFPLLKDRFLHDIRQQDLVALCLLLQQLLNQLCHGVTVYCVIDSVCHYETSLGSWEQELCEIVKFLQYLTINVGDQRPGPVLKVLMTATNKSIKIHQHVHPDDQISLSTGNMLCSPVQPISFKEEMQRAMEFNGWHMNAT